MGPSSPSHENSFFSNIRRYWLQWITPRATDMETALQERIVRQVSGVIVILSLIALPIILASDSHVIGLPVTAFWLCMMAVIAWNLQKDRVRQAADLLVLTMTLVAIGLNLKVGYWSAVSAIFLLMSFIFSGVLRRRRSVLEMAGVGILVVAVVIVTSNFEVGHAGRKLVDAADIEQAGPNWILAVYGIGFTLISYLLYQYRDEFDRRSTRLDSLVIDLEAQVQARTRQMMAAAEVGREIATQIEQETLMLEIVRQTTSRFRLYGACLFVRDEIAGAYNQVAGIDKLGNHTLPIMIPLDTPGSSVLRAADAREPVIIHDVNEVEGLIHHPGLAATRSELILPLVIGDKVIGVLGLAAASPGFFGEDDVVVLGIVADQVAVALRNSQIYDTVRANLWTEIQERSTERERMQQELITAQQNALRELALPIIPIMDGVIIAPLIGSIDSTRAQDILHGMLDGINRYKARVVIIDVTGVPIVDTGVAAHFNHTIQAIQLKGARAILTGITDAVAEAVVDLGIDWSHVETVAEMQTGLLRAVDYLETSLT